MIKCNSFYILPISLGGILSPLYIDYNIYTYQTIIITIVYFISFSILFNIFPNISKFLVTRPLYITDVEFNDTDLDALGGNVGGYMMSPLFGKSPHDRVEYHIYDPNIERLFSNHKAENWTIDTDSEGMPQINLQIKEDLEALNLTNGAYTVIYNFHRDAVGGPIGPKFKVHSISKDRKEVRLLPNPLILEELSLMIV